jgi:hypothetical protein
MNSKWRPMMGWSYMLTCIADFVIFPVLWSVLQSLSKGQVNIQWQPITLQGAGLYHIAMGAVLGIAAYGRTQEKLGGANNGGINLPSNVGSTYQIPGSTPQSGLGTFGAPTATTVTHAWGSQPSNAGFASTSTGFGAAASTEIITGWGGKTAPVIPPFPER